MAKQHALFLTAGAYILWKQPPQVHIACSQVQFVQALALYTRALLIRDAVPASKTAIL